MVRRLLLFAALAAASGARAQDAALARLIEEAAAASPEVAQARAEVDAERARIPQAGALPDPTLSFGVSRMMPGFVYGGDPLSMNQVMLTQSLPVNGSLGLRRDALVAAGDLSGRLLIEVTNPLRMGAAGLELSLGFDRSAAEQIASLAPGAARIRSRAGSTGGIRAGLNGPRSTVRARPSTISSVTASPVAGALRMPQTLCPVAI